MSEPFNVEISNLWKRYQRNWVLQEVTLRIPRGEVVLLAGPNGAGKSTLLRVLATAIRADAGVVRVAGLDVKREKDLVRRVTTLLAHTTYTYDTLTARQNLVVWNGHLGRRPSREEVDAILHRVGLFARGDDPVSRFSAGMRKRLSLGRVLLQALDSERRLVLLDEPYEQLDRDGFALIDSLVNEWRAEGRSVLLATHMTERAIETVDRAVLLRSGRVSFSGDPIDLPAALAATGGQR
jgi:ABC-type multidrug transport system ATPase subunit